jgi:hypothetical protein
MHDHEKSDPSIVAVKPSNKAGQPAAELVEPRVGPRGVLGVAGAGRTSRQEFATEILAAIAKHPDPTLAKTNVERHRLQNVAFSIEASTPGLRRNYR